MEMRCSSCSASSYIAQMNTFIALQLIGGILLLYAGAELLVRGGAALALRVGISPLVVGLTIISFGTSAPELVVSLKAALDHDSAIALGNVIGSNIANLALVLGLSATIRPLRVEHQVVRQDMPILLIATLAIVGVLWNGQVSQMEGGLLFSALIIYILISIRRSRQKQQNLTPSLNKRVSTPVHNGWAQAAILVLGIGLLIPGSQMLLRGAIHVATDLGWSPLVIGLTIVAIGTSLPEIATSVVAAIRREGDLAVGNAVGSNIFNILCILGLTALLFGIDGGGVNWVDLGVMSATVIVCLPIMRSGFVISRLEGILLLSGYAGYMVYLIQGHS